MVTVRTSHFSLWQLGAVDYDLSKPLAPVAAAPVVNTVKAGSTIPLKFRLGGDRGLDVLSSTPTVTVSTACTKTAKTNAVKAVGSSGTSVLTYDKVSDTYTYSWRTTTAMKGCKELTLAFRDGSELHTLYLLS